MFVNPTEARRGPRLLVTAVLDVLLFLLAVLVLLVLSLNRSPAPRDVRLASVDSGSTNCDLTPVVDVVIDASGRCRIDGQAVRGGVPATLNLIAARRAGAEPLVVRVVPDQGAPFAAVAELLDGLKRRGITRVGTVAREVAPPRD